jgi:hypothetical protein
MQSFPKFFLITFFLFQDFQQISRKEIEQWWLSIPQILYLGTDFYWQISWSFICCQWSQLTDSCSFCWVRVECLTPLLITFFLFQDFQQISRKEIEQWWLSIPQILTKWMTWCIRYIVAISSIVGGNRSSRRKPPFCRKLLTNFIT